MAEHTDLSPAQQDALAEHTADMIMTAARAQYPDNPVKAAACAIYAAASVQLDCDGPTYPGTRRSAENASPAEVEAMISGARIPWNGKLHEGSDR